MQPVFLSPFSLFIQALPLQLTARCEKALKTRVIFRGCKIIINKLQRKLIFKLFAELKLESARIVLVV